MAAHQLTGLLEVIACTRSLPANKLADMLRPAVNLSCWTEQNYRAWEVLNEFVEQCDIVAADHAVIPAGMTEQLRDSLIGFLPAVIAEWQSYDKPRTLEEWYSRKYDPEC